MKRILLSGLVLAAVTAAAGCRGPRGRQGEPAPTPTPGNEGAFDITLTQATVGSAGTVYVDFAVTDADGLPRTIDGIQTFWTLAILEEDTAVGTHRWRSFITRHVTSSSTGDETDQPTNDPAPAIADLGGGSYRYAYSVPLPSGYDANATYRAAMWARRPLPPEAEDTYEVENNHLDFVPSGGAAVSKEVVVTEACNVCHDRLAIHGGVRTDIELCVTCHNPGLFDPDSDDTAQTETMNLLDLGPMAHRIHMGIELPSMAIAQSAGVLGWSYEIFGFNNSRHVYAETIDDNTDAGTKPQIEGVGFPRDIRGCEACHQGTEALRYTTSVDRRACQSCHDRTWFGDPGATPPRMLPHTAGPVLDDSACQTCHPADSGEEFDPSVIGAHTDPLKSTQLRGLHVEVNDVAIAGTGLSVTFTVENADDGSPILALPTNLSTLAITLSGPTEEYEFRNFHRADVRATAVFDAGSGTYTALVPPRPASDPYFPSGTAIPPGATGTFALAIDARRSVPLAGDGTVTEPPDTNAVTYFTASGTGTPEPRRQIVEQARCLACHDVLLLHGGQRRDVEYCVVCHNPTQTDWGRRPKVGGAVNIGATEDLIEERTVDFKRLIHRIHTGENLERTDPFVVYGFGASVNDFSGIRFPGNRARCGNCHLPDTWLIESIPDTAQPTVANETSTPLHGTSAAHPLADPEVPKIQAACLSCHDSDAAWVHAQLNTLDGEETCIICHGEGRTAAVGLVHDIDEGD